MNKKIGMFDSGKGGMTILSAVKNRLPEEEYKYIADTKNCPYGEKSEEELYKIVQQNVEELKDWGATIIVIACNTATVKCIKRLRRDYPDLIFVGTEPAIKLALESGAQKILVLATPNTIASEKLKSIAHKNKQDEQTIDFLACPGLAETIERHYGHNEEIIKAKLEELLKYDETYDAVVLGCTHYPLIRGLITNFYPNAKLIDGSDGVARRVEELAKTL